MNRLPRFGSWSPDQCGSLFLCFVFGRVLPKAPMILEAIHFTEYVLMNWRIHPTTWFVWNFGMVSTTTIGPMWTSSNQEPRGSSGPRKAAQVEIISRTNPSILTPVLLDTQMNECRSCVGYLTRLWKRL
ncbi:hypothetical protein ASPSYDRAFT_662971 [Aspergillus sydowii CBS 593.65]|uniref:Uncharacterized protein n=1 Tax=Aspergillus sydowii CBS 593.65 TaxID=1036612 RepID=A0A1L9TTG7_9EURO|nr:uncharacterized protein ASPSYDRAFT_662971 [Aspergillus sydowii CBS 593.65]OJJ62750.1 hypothetical protein ASPSYDRAFT_662971 [Aspergillus sydowii CBS 593.65]